MNVLKPIFFSKYKPTTTYDYPEWRDISFKVKGKNISVLVREGGVDAKGIVVLCHPQLKEGKQFFIKMGHDKMYRAYDLHTVIFDFNGFGESEDQGLDFDVDIHEVLKKIKSLYPHLPITLHGISFGGSQLITGTLLDQSLVDKIIIENAISATEEYYKHRGYKLQYLVMKLYYNIFPKERSKSKYYQLISKIKNIPILFIYGTKDVKTPVWMGDKLYNGAHEPKQMEIFDAEHLNTITVHEQRYVALISDFVRK